MKFKAVIFDLDGVLVDTEGFQWQGWLPPLKRFGVELSKEQYFDYAGKTGSDIDAQLIERFKIPAGKGTLVAEKEKLLMKWFKEKPLKTRPFAEKAIKEALASGLKIAVCTTGSREQSLLKLEKTGIKKYFETIVTIEMVAKGKPAPDIYLKTAESLGLMPFDCVAIEDSEYGVKSAKSAGMACAAIPDEWSARQSFEKADKICRNLKEAIGWIKSR